MVWEATFLLTQYALADVGPSAYLCHPDLRHRAGVGRAARFRRLESDWGPAESGAAWASWRVSPSTPLPRSGAPLTSYAW